MAILQEAQKVVPGASFEELLAPLSLPDEIRVGLLAEM